MRALAQSVEGTLSFAGEATAGGRAGTVDGALATEERAAREVLASLRRRGRPATPPATPGAPARWP